MIKVSFSDTTTSPRLLAQSGAHYSFDHALFSGLVFPTLRRVVGLTPTGPLISGPTAILLLIPIS
jgi:hypothetical protein